jgi:hypothetical protein
MVFIGLLLLFGAGIAFLYSLVITADYLVRRLAWKRKHGNVQVIGCHDGEHLPKPYANALSVQPERPRSAIAVSIGGLTLIVVLAVWISMW